VIGFFAPPQTLPGGADWPKFNQLEMVTFTFTYIPTNKQTNHRHDRLQYTVPQLARSVIKSNSAFSRTIWSSWYQKRSNIFTRDGKEYQLVKL